ncbi:MAG: hypothetical protein ACRD9W_06585 [Terriglobia bacterium]
MAIFGTPSTLVYNKKPRDKLTVRRPTADYDIDLTAKLSAALHESVYGPSRHALRRNSSVAIGGIPDIGLH